MSQSSDERRKHSRRRSRGERERSKSESKKKRHRRADDDGDRGHERRERKHSRHRDRDRERRRYRSRSRSRSRSLSNSDREEKDRHRSHRRKREHTSKHSSKRSSSKRNEKSSNSRKHKRSKRTFDRKRSSRSRSRSVEDKRRETIRTSSSSAQIKVDLIPLGPISSTPPEKTIHPKNDYFAFHNHLRLFLYRNEKQTFFEDLSSDESHAAFQRFCKQYNEGMLEEAYYKKELPEDAMGQCKRTKHAWNFRTSTAEEKSLNVIKSGVKRQTQYKQLPPMVCRPIPRTGISASSTTTATSTRNESGDIREGRRAMIPPRSDVAVASLDVPSTGIKSQTDTIGKGDKESDDTQSKEAMLKSLGLSGLIKPGQKITIAPRK